MSTAIQLLYTAEEFARRPDPGYPEELVRGRIVSMPPPQARHGQVCSTVVYTLKRFLEDHDLGHVLSNDSGVITERGPDTVRGADVSFYSYSRVPKGPLPSKYLDVPPDLVIEVRSPDDRWPRILRKVAEYLEAGVAIVGVLDPEWNTLHLYEGDQRVRILSEHDELTLPGLLGEFRVAVSRFFE
ncbi:MAG: Uma2 family endonuclease [Isosphaerales bacterium]